MYQKTQKEKPNNPIKNWALETTMRYHLKSVEMASIKITRKTFGEDVRKGNLCKLFLGMQICIAVLYKR